MVVSHKVFALSRVAKRIQRLYHTGMVGYVRNSGGRLPTHTQNSQRSNTMNDVYSIPVIGKSYAFHNQPRGDEKAHKTLHGIIDRELESDKPYESIQCDVCGIVFKRR